MEMQTTYYTNLNDEQGKTTNTAKPISFNHRKNEEHPKSAYIWVLYTSESA